MTPAGEQGEQTVPEAAIWQDVEFGAYTADLPLWEELANASKGGLLELGAGSGRVALHLARAGVPVTALEADHALAEELDRRARAEELPVLVAPADIVALDQAWPQASASISAAIAPLHIIQQLDPADRPRLLARLAERLPAGTPVAAVLVDESSLLDSGLEADQVPDMRDIGGWVYSSEPLWVQVDAGALRIRRLRTRIAPDGEVERTVRDELLHRLRPEALEDEARDAGLAPAGRRAIASGPSEADSIAVLLEAP
ncbi:MAG TPA: class I SAM-dependent methyltransferase [Solirubrobacterales bacterium]|nr:class I SAM-dependent methyltransferase [Solirubrobacterales bacterium]